MVKEKTGGGVLIGLRSSFNCELIDTSFFDLTFPYIQLLICRCAIDCVSLYVVVIYIQPDISIDNFTAFLEALEQIELLHSNSVIVLGDFNIKNYVNNDCSDTKTFRLNSLIEFFNLKQCNNVLNIRQRLLDLVLCNKNCVVERDNLPFTTENSDHPALRISCTDLMPRKQNFSFNLKARNYNFKRANFPALYYEITTTDWSYLLTISDVNAAVQMFNKRLFDLIDAYVPLYKQYSHRYPKWYTSEIIKNIKTKAKLHKKFKKTKNPNIYQEFSRLRATVKSQIKEAYKSYTECVEQLVQNDSRSFWSYVHDKNNTSRIPGVMQYDGETLEEPVPIVNAFAHFFNSVFSPPDEADAHEDTYQSLFSNSSTISLNNISEAEVIKAGKKLKDKMTSGPDGIPSFLVKDCISVLSEPLGYLFNLFVRSGEFPRLWKETRVCPIYKSDSKNLVTNYRPISLLCNFSKVFEIILCDRIGRSVSSSLSIHQHGFFRKRSTVTNLANLTEFMKREVDNSGQVDVIYADFSKAFDKIPHNILLMRLAKIGLNTRDVKLFKSYLSDRQLSVFYNGFESLKFVSTSGVPQGSNLGPLMFIIFIDDLLKILGELKLAFADDFKLFSSINNMQDCWVLQEQVDKLSLWCKDNKLNLNIGKCKVVTYTRRKSPIVFEYSIDGTALSRSDSMRDLGVIFDTKLSFDKHIQAVTCEAGRLYGFIVRNCKQFTYINALKALFFAYVRSKLEYASIIWDPLYNNKKWEIEKLQKRFLKYLYFKVEGVYPARGIDYRFYLDRFQFTSLEGRRDQNSVIFLYKLLNNFIDSPVLLGYVNFRVPRLGSRHTELFYTDRANSNLLLSSPIYNSCSNFNKISTECDIFNCSLDQLKRVLYVFS